MNREIVEKAAQIADAAVRAAERERNREREQCNVNAEAMALVARDVAAGIAAEIRKLASARCTWIHDEDNEVSRCHRDGTATSDGAALCGEHARLVALVEKWKGR